MNRLLVNDIEVKLSNLDKVLWPEEGITKGDMINYYIEIYPLIKDYLKDRPLSLKAFPDGIAGKTFYQKNTPEHAPDWLSTYPIYSSHRQEPIKWVVVNKIQDLIWIANMASIELHGWFSSTRDLLKPDFAVFDLDPGKETGFPEALEIALLLKEILDELKMQSFVKTSGKTGLHIYLPLVPIYTYKEVKKFLNSIARLVIELKPEIATTIWRKKDREGKVYIDYRQNEKGKTIPAPYSLRPTIRAAVSAPLSWDDLKPGLKPEDFNFKTIKDRLTIRGDLWSNLLNSRQELPRLLI